MRSTTGSDVYRGVRRPGLLLIRADDFFLLAQGGRGGVGGGHGTFDLSFNTIIGTIVYATERKGLVLKTVDAHVSS